MNQPSAEIRGFVSMGVQGVMDAARPPFERASGYRLALSFSTSKSLSKRLTEGEIADLVIATPLILEPLVAAGLIAPGSVVALASSGVGIAVRRGAPKPDISTPESFKQTLLSARTIGHSDPAGGGASGVHFSQLIERLGIADAIRPKCRLAPTGTHSADLLLTGEAELAVQQIPELAYVDGIEVLGPLPGDLQLITTFAGCIHAQAAQPEGAKSLLNYLKSPAGLKAIKAQRLEPA
jgi:molybdate transport system substrate-binding protein